MSRQPSDDDITRQESFFLFPNHLHSVEGTVSYKYGYSPPPDKYNHNISFAVPSSLQVPQAPLSIPGTPPCPYWWLLNNPPPDESCYKHSCESPAHTCYLQKTLKAIYLYWLCCFFANQPADWCHKKHNKDLKSSRIKVVIVSRHTQKAKLLIIKELIFYLGPQDQGSPIWYSGPNRNHLQTDNQTNKADKPIKWNSAL